MSRLSFLNPWLLAGLGAIAIPIIIHLIARRLALLHRFAAIEFLMRSQRRIAARFELRQLLLLLMRCAAIVLLCLALARPIWSRLGGAPTAGHEPASVAMIVDNSYSMRCVPSGRETLFDRARAAARALLRSLPRSDNAALFLGAAPSPSSASGLTFDTASLLGDLDAAQCSFGTTDAASWTKTALAALRESKLHRKRVCLVTDGAAHGWRREQGEGLAAQLKASAIPCDVLTVAGSEHLENTAVQDLKVLKSESDALLITAKIANHTAGRLSNAVCHVSVDGKRAASGFVDVPAGAVAAKEFSLGFVSPGYHVAAVQVEPGDPLAADDVRRVSLTTGRPIEALVVDGAPGPHIYAGESYYLERALSPDAGGRGPLHATVVTEAQFRGLKPADYEVLFLCNVRTVPMEKVREIIAFLEKGGGLFISLGDNVDAGYYDRSLGAILAQPLRDVKDLGGAVPFKVPDDEKNALIQALRQAGVDLGRATVRKVFVLEAAAGGARRLVSLSNDLPALVERSVGAGRVLLFASTVDRAWTDLPINTAFLPFVQITTRYLAGRMKDPPRLDTTVGRRVELAVPPACTRARITAPREIVKEFEVSGLPLAGTPPARRLSFADTSAPGAYEIAFLGMPRGEERLGFVVNLDAESESDLRRISDQELAWFGGHRVESPVRGEVSMSYLDFQVERGLWAPLLAGVLFLLVGECLLARRP